MPCETARVSYSGCPILAYRSASVGFRSSRYRSDMNP